MRAEGRHRELVVRLDSVLAIDTAELALRMIQANGQIMCEKTLCVARVAPALVASASTISRLAAMRL